MKAAPQIGMPAKTYTSATSTTSFSSVAHEMVEFIGMNKLSDTDEASRLALDTLKRLRPVSREETSFDSIAGPDTWSLADNAPVEEFNPIGQLEVWQQLQSDPKPRVPQYSRPWIGFEPGGTAYSATSRKAETAKQTPKTFLGLRPEDVSLAVVPEPGALESPLQLKVRHDLQLAASQIGVHLDSVVSQATLATRR